MAVMDLGTFNSNKIYFVLVIIEYRKEFAKITAKSKKETRQSSKVDIADFIDQHLIYNILLIFNP